LVRRSCVRDGPYNFRGCDITQEIRIVCNNGQMTAHDSCIIVPPSGVTTVAEFPAGWQAWSQKTGYITPPTPYFAALVPYSQTAGVGSLLVIGNSGWLADEGSPMPAPGLAPYSSNLQFALNCIGYMGASATQSKRAGQAAG
jgi:hypothetical protein